MPVARIGLKHADAVALTVEEGDVLADTRYFHRLTQDPAAGLGHLLHCGVNVIDGDHDRGMLCRPVRPLWKETAIDRAGLS